MVSKRDLLDKARELIRPQLKPFIRSELFHPEGGFYKIVFTNGSALFITYNNHSEYSCQYLYSLKENDRERFDNYESNGILVQNLIISIPGINVR